MRERRLAGLLALGLLLVGCGAPAAPAAPAAGGAFPVTVTHGQGTVTIPATPRRVVVLGMADAQIASALGAPVVGAARNPTSADGVWLGVSPPLPATAYTLDPITPNIEAIAALQPDLILMTTAQPTFVAIYDKLSAIAPTISYKSAVLQDSGDDLVRLIGQALGKPAEADALIQRSDAELARFAGENPRLASTRYAFGQFAAGATYLVTAPNGPSARWLGKLGLRQPEAITGLPIWQAGMVQLSAEQLGLLDEVDVALIAMPTPADGQTFLAQPLVANSRLAQRGGVHQLTPAQSALLLIPNPASTPALLEIVRPILGAG